MWEQILKLVSLVLGPRVLRNVSGVDEGEIFFAISGTATRIIIPDWLKGRYAEFTALGADVDVLMGGATVVAVFGQVSTIGSEAVTVHASSGRRVVQNTTRAWIVPSDPLVLRLSAIGSGAGFLQISVTSKKIE